MHLIVVEGNMNMAMLSIFRLLGGWRFVPNFFSLSCLFLMLFLLSSPRCFNW